MFYLRYILIITTTSAFISTDLNATDLNYSVSVSLSKIDNINLVANPVDSETSQSVRGEVSIEENTAELVASLSASVEAINYQNDQAQDENIGNLSTNALWVLSPGYYEWFLSDTYTQTITSALDANNQNNRVDTNAFSTGPNLTWRVNSRNDINLDARAESIVFENNTNVVDGDNNRLLGTTGWAYQLDSSSSLSINYQLETVDFDDEINNSNFDRVDVFLNYNKTRGRNLFEVSAGTTKVNNETASDTRESRFSVSLQNERTRTSSIRLAISRNITDTSRELIEAALDDPEEIDPETQLGVQSNVFLDKTASITYTKTLSFGSLTVDLSKSIDDYQLQNNEDQEEEIALITGVWNMQRASSLTMTAQYTNNLFTNISREDETFLYSLLYTYNARRNISTDVEVIARERESTDANEVYDDFRIRLSLTYNTR